MDIEKVSWRSTNFAKVLDSRILTAFRGDYLRENSLNRYDYMGEKKMLLGILSLTVESQLNKEA